MSTNVKQTLWIGWNAIRGGYKSDLAWIFRQGTTLLQRLFPPPLTFLYWHTSLANIDRFLQPGRRAQKNYRDWYAGVFAVVLILLLAFYWHVPKRLALVIAGYRGYDILVYRSYFLLVKGQRRPPWRGNADNVRRGITFALVNFCEIVLGYAVIYLLSNHISQGGCTCNPVLASRRQAFYFSFVTMVTFGPGDFSPNNDCMRVIMAFQMATAILFLIFIIPALISLLTESGKKPGAGGSLF